MEFKLILKKLRNNLSQEEEAIFDNWFNEANEHQEYFNKVKKNFELDPEAVNLNKAWEKITSQIDQPVKHLSYWKYAIAASVVLVISISALFYSRLDKEYIALAELSHSIKAGSKKALLTLNNGETINLEKGQTYNSVGMNSNGVELLYEIGTNQPRNINEINYLTVPRGGEFFVQLTDGTKIWLNSDTKIKYPTYFKPGKTREVELIYGEAYFDISSAKKNNGASFKVLCRNQEIEVMGTAFNLKAYSDEKEVLTTLVEGKVAINLDGKRALLNPNFQSKTSTGFEDISIKEVEVYNEISWVKGLFSFKDKPLDEIMKVLSRWYNFETVFANNNSKNLKFNGVISRKQDIDTFLKIICKTNNIAYDIEDKKVTIR